MKLGSFALPLLCSLAAALPARTEEDPLLPPHVNFEQTQDDVTARLDRLEEQLGQLNAKIDRLEMLIRGIYGERIRRVEAVDSDPALAQAVQSLEAKYHVRGAVDALVSEESEKLSTLHRSLSRAAASAGVKEFAGDLDVIRVVTAMATRRDFLATNKTRIVTALTARDDEATRTMVIGLLEQAAPAAHEAALWAAIGVGGPELLPTMSAYAASVSPEQPQLAALAMCAAAASGDAASARRLLKAVRKEDLPRSYVYELANCLRSAGKSTSFRIYAELLLDEKYAFAAAQAFSGIEGFMRRVDWREVKEERTELYDEFRAWLDEHESGLVYDTMHSRFRMGNAGAP